MAVYWIRRNLFQSTSLTRGTTVKMLRNSADSFHFNPRPSQEGRPGMMGSISIRLRFQSTSLTRGTTLSEAEHSRFHHISIHVPHKRDDGKNTQYSSHITNYITTNQTIQPNTGSSFSPLSSHIYVFRRQILGANPPEKSRSLAIRTAPSPIDLYVHLPKTREVTTPPWSMWTTPPSWTLQSKQHSPQ